MPVLAHESSVGIDDALTQRIRREYLEMPGLQLTVAQAARLWHIDAGAGRRALDALVDTAFLRRRETWYERSDEDQYEVRRCP